MRRNKKLSQKRQKASLKDKKLIQVQQRLDSVDEIEQIAKVWRETAKDLASVVIRTCATVEELPKELWTSTTPGLFTSVYDDLQNIRNLSKGVNNSDPQEEQQQSYARKRKECVMANRNLLARCLKYSKVSLTFFIWKI